MRKTVMMMMGMLHTSTAQLAAPDKNSAAILLLDFRKAHDTVDRDFLFLALTRFGFSPAFVAMIRDLHVRTTVQFLVNGELSKPQEVVSGIR